MKKALCILLCIVLSAGFTVTAFAEDTKNEVFGSYERVFIIGVDGAGSWFQKLNTPNFDRIFADGAVKYDARTETKSDSGPNWGAMLTGVSYIWTGMQNGTVSSVERSSDTKYKSIFYYARQQFPDAELASYCNWDPINFGIIETDIGVNKQHVSGDENLTQAICDYFNAGNDPKLFFVQLDEVDGAGHGPGSDSQEYADAVKEADERLGRIYDAIDANGLLENSLFITVADHGHKATGGHGKYSIRESTAMLAVAGKNVKKGANLDGTTRLRDVSAIALYALGIKRPFNMTSRVPFDCFEGVTGEVRAIWKDPIDFIVAAVMGVYTGLTALFDTDK